MSIIASIKQKLGLSVTPANNFTWDASADNGTCKLARGNPGATTQDILTVDSAGKIAIPQGLLGFTVSITSTNGYIICPSWFFGGLHIEWGTATSATGADFVITYQSTFSNAPWPIAVNGDATSTNNLTINLYTQTVSDFRVTARIGSTGVVSATAYRINWIAIGK